MLQNQAPQQGISNAHYASHRNRFNKFINQRLRPGVASGARRAVKDVVGTSHPVAAIQRLYARSGNILLYRSVAERILRCGVISTI